MRLNDTLMTGIVASVAALAFMITPKAATVETGFVVAAPDRGFMGNEEVRDAFRVLDEYPAELVFVTDERGQPYFDAAVERLRDEDISRIVVLPLYLSDANPGLDTLRTYISAHDMPIEIGRIFGRSVAAPAVLADRLRASGRTSGRIFVAGDTLQTAGQAEGLREDLEQIVAAVSAEFPQLEISTLAWSEDQGGMEAGMKALPEGSTVLPFHFGSKLDSMMAYSAYLGYYAPEGVEIIDSEITPHPAVGAWLQREAARNTPLPKGKTGVVIHAHGSDFHWNETMRKAAAALEDDYLVEYAFSMGDPPTLERALQRLEARGARAAVIVRIFGLERSFRDGIDRLIGSDFENCTPVSASAHHHGHGDSAAAARIPSPMPVVSVGGIEDHPYFAKALLDRAQKLSEDAERETVILVAHGVGDEKGNQYWIELLESLRAQMLEAGGDDFRAIHVATWREDWPDKREAAVAHIRELIENADADGGRALVIPARTTSTGNARELIPDLEYTLGSGFAPHPLFTRWLKEQVSQGVATLHSMQATALNCEQASAASSHAHH